MTFNEIVRDAHLYIDANIFVYYFGRSSNDCTALIDRCERGEIKAYTGTHVLLEVAHRLMMTEAVDKGFVTPGNVPRKLRLRPELASQLNEYSEAIQHILDIGIEMLQVDVEILEISANLRAQTGFLINDSISLAMMRRYDIKAIATNDRDFQRVVGLEVQIPSDL